MLTVKSYKEYKENCIKNNIKVEDMFSEKEWVDLANEYVVNEIYKSEQNKVDAERLYNFKLECKMRRENARRRATIIDGLRDI